MAKKPIPERIPKDKVKETLSGYPTKSNASLPAGTQFKIEFKDGEPSLYEDSFIPTGHDEAVCFPCLKAIVGTAERFIALSAFRVKSAMGYKEIRENGHISISKEIEGVESKGLCPETANYTDLFEAVMSQGENSVYYIDAIKLWYDYTTERGTRRLSRFMTSAAKVETPTAPTAKATKKG